MKTHMLILKSNFDEKSENKQLINSLYTRTISMQMNNIDIYVHSMDFLDDRFDVDRVRQ